MIPFLSLLIEARTFKKVPEKPIPMCPNGGYYHFLSANDKDWKERFIISQLENITGNWSCEETGAPQGVPGEKMFFMELGSAYYGASTQFVKPLILQNQTLVVQYEVRLQNDLECGGAYVKLFSDENYVPEKVSNETKYSIMFGPDKCGGTNKVHFIFRHKNILSGAIEEKHLKDPPQIKSDKISHLYTLIVRKDNSYEILIDGESSKSGSLLTDFDPAVFPKKDIDDPNDTKPADWVDAKQIPDPNATKPEDWDEDEPQFINDTSKFDPPEGWLEDEPKMIKDPNATKPADWDEEVLGEWEAPDVPNPLCVSAPGCGPYEVPVIPNPKYKGKWSPPMIDNPEYKGEWKPKQIPNPYYYEDRHPHNFMPITAVGFDLWEVNRMIGFTNIYIGTDEDAVYKWNRDHFIPKHKKQEKANSADDKTEQKKELGGLYMKAVKGCKQIWKNFVTLYIAYQWPTIGACAIIVVLNIIVFVLCARSSNYTTIYVNIKVREEPNQEKEENKEEKEENKEESDDEKEKKSEIEDKDEKVEKVFYRFPDGEKLRH
ncbi:Calreticulin family protein [Trichomonas vaginalis G3]|uniref:Calreticulin family protein n=1 Tax=Trichomonas vaginalis (strain ATCC PRA-98 / G3) TaxID=412133 RepID=A2G7S4_TRIV3|nr:chaperone protein, calreticulin/calnexin family [Trichomonas vaginalis G3]EAX86791.1 Calreticulin family protein [Trichomonas vaginalis G3]KAI5526496.1 chaperone protein, calreticulin/calnexin family [Trichomonas vaginalis G3]|eukprot:XP_001299721.1 Calreticulin family protein [Trichomonas vaginalis G3]